jgi:hypothetical protein
MKKTSIKRLKKLMLGDSASYRTKMEMVLHELKDEIILSVREKKMTYTQISTMLTSNGFKVSRNTIARYYNKFTDKQTTINETNNLISRSSCGQVAVKASAVLAQNTSENVMTDAHDVLNECAKKNQNKRDTSNEKCSINAQEQAQADTNLTVVDEQLSVGFVGVDTVNTRPSRQGKRFEVKDDEPI